jgi:hypothetical protein
LHAPQQADPPSPARSSRHLQSRLPPSYSGLPPNEALAAYEAAGLEGPSGVLALPDSFGGESSSDEGDDSDGGAAEGAAAGAAAPLGSPPGARRGGRKGVGRGAGGAAAHAAAEEEDDEGDSGFDEDAAGEEEEEEEEAADGEEAEEEGGESTAGRAASGAARSASGSAAAAAAGGGGGGDAAAPGGAAGAAASGRGRSSGSCGGGGSGGAVELDPARQLRRSGYWWRFEFDDTALKWVAPAPEGGYARVDPVRELLREEGAGGGLGTALPAPRPPALVRGGAPACVLAPRAAAAPTGRGDFG